MVTLLSAVTYCFKKNEILVCMQVTEGSLYKTVRKVNKVRKKQYRTFVYTIRNRTLLVTMLPSFGKEN